MECENEWCRLLLGVVGGAGGAELMVVVFLRFLGNREREEEV